MSDGEEQTRVTSIHVMNPEKDDRRGQDDCLVLIYSKDQQQLGKRFVLQQSGMTCGRGQDNHIVFEGDSVSRKHCHFDRLPDGWAIIDDHSTNGTYVNDVLLEAPKILESGDRIKVGPTIMKYLSGSDVETLYHEEIYPNHDHRRPHPNSQQTTLAGIARKRSHARASLWA